jgi:hypothetical protein
MAHTISIDVVDITIPIGNNRTIPVINQSNPCYEYAANANEVRQLIQLSIYKITEAGTNKPITGKNYYEYFPEEQPGGGGGGGVTPEQVQAMINSSIDSTVSDSSTNAIQNKSIKSYVDTGLADKASTSSLSPVATSGSYNDLSNKPTIDSELSDSSTNAVQNKVITGTIGDINAVLEEVL